MSVLTGEIATVKKSNIILQDTHETVKQAHADSLETVKGHVAVIKSSAGDDNEMKELENKLEKTKALTADKMRALEHMKKQVDVLTSESLRKDGDLDYAQKDVVSKIAELKGRSAEIERLRKCHDETDRDRARLKSNRDLD